MNGGMDRFDIRIQVKIYWRAEEAMPLEERGAVL